ncbi:MAG: hypothetical protein EBS18_03745 [Actinobacteria bacterium]|nr:hypothetical protein [Actinomycetota bacterium]
MAIVEFSQLDVSFRGTEANNIFLEPVFFDDDLRSQFRVLGNVANKKKMVFVAALENIVRKYSGCGFTPVDTGSGSALAAGDGFGILRAVYDQAPLQLKGLPANQKVFNVTGSVYSQLREDIEEGGGGDYGLLQLINGQEQFTFRGVPVVAQWRWDEIATSLGTTLPNYVEYTTPLNKVLATDVLSPETALELWYDQKEEKVYVKARFKMGVNYIHNSLISVGY